MRFIILCTPGTVGMTAVGRLVARSPIRGDCHMMKRRDIELSRYETRLGKGGKPEYFAIDKDGKEYQMPAAFSEAYTDDFLQIRWTQSEMPEVLNLPEEGFWIPIRTAPLTKKVKA